MTTYYHHHHLHHLHHYHHFRLSIPTTQLLLILPPPLLLLLLLLPLHLYRSHPIFFPHTLLIFAYLLVILVLSSASRIHLRVILVLFFWFQLYLFVILVLSLCNCFNFVKHPPYTFVSHPSISSSSWHCYPQKNKCFHLSLYSLSSFYIYKKIKKGN